MLLKEFLEIFVSYVSVTFRESKSFDEDFLTDDLLNLNGFNCNCLDVDLVPVNILNMKITFIYISTSNVCIYLK